MKTRITQQCLILSALLLLIGSSCSDNSGVKQELAATQMALISNQQMAAKQAEMAKKDIELAKAKAYQDCVAANKNNASACDAIKPASTSP